MNGSLVKVLKVGIVVGAGLFAFGCGSGGSKNDQGVSFTLNGFAPIDSSDSSDSTQGLVGTTATFGSEVSQVAVELQNNLYGQGIRVRRLYLSYNIPGENVSLPSTSVGITTVLGPSECADVTDRNCVTTTLPAGFKTENVSKVGFPIVPSTVTDYLVLNRDSLPSLPFFMEVTVVAEGVTTAGDTLVSNDGVFTVEYLPDNTPAGVEPTPAA